MMCDIENEICGGFATKESCIKAIKLLCERIGKTENEINAVWCLGISALIMMNALNNDDMNGMITTMTVK
jgi:phosphopantetheinyl transferase (holo-ACP synthase)